MKTDPLVGVEDLGRPVRGERLLDAGANARRAAPELLANLAAAGVGHLEAHVLDGAHGELASLALERAAPPPGLAAVARPGDIQQLELAGGRDLSVCRVDQARPRCRCRSA